MASPKQRRLPSRTTPNEEHGNSIKPEPMSTVRPALLAWLCYGIFFGAFLSEAVQGTKYLMIPCVLFGSAMTCRKLLEFRGWGNEIPHLRTFFICTALLVIELTIENFFVWVVSATDARRMKRLAPLQDNVEIGLRQMMDLHPMLHWMLRFKWVHTMQFLSVSILIALSVLWYQIPYSGFRIMSRFVLTLAVSRAIRIVCFMITVLPSPKPGCYLRRFPAVPDTWGAFIKVGFREMAGRGGCNDLIFSGHCNLWTMAPLLYHSYYEGQCAMFLWIALIQTSLRTVLEHHHYSVDMFLAIVITSLVWRELTWICPEHETTSNISTGLPHPFSKVLSVFVICILLVVVGLTILSAA